MYRILWTHAGVDGGWFKDVDAPDAASAAWQIATSAPADQDNPLRLVSVTELPPSPESS